MDLFPILYNFSELEVETDIFSSRKEKVPLLDPVLYFKLWMNQKIEKEWSFKVKRCGKVLRCLHVIFYFNVIYWHSFWGISK